MRKALVALLLTAALSLFATALTGTGDRETLSPHAPADDKPDLIIVYSGDLQGYLKECG